MIIVLNKITQHPFEVNRSFLMEKYPCIAGFVRTDCKDGEGLSELRELVCSQTDTMDNRKTYFPSDWFSIKDRLSQMKEDFISWEDYQQICCAYGERDPQAQHNLARFLHILGIVLHFGDDPSLDDTRVLKPTWVTEGIYSLLRAARRQNSNGMLSGEDVAQALDLNRYPVSKHSFLLRLMERFQLCFRMPGNDERYLVPELLDDNQPDVRASRWIHRGSY